MPVLSSTSCRVAAQASAETVTPAKLRPPRAGRADAAGTKAVASDLAVPGIGQRSAAVAGT